MQAASKWRSLRDVAWASFFPDPSNVDARRPEVHRSALTLVTAITLVRRIGRLRPIVLWVTLPRWDGLTRTHEDTMKALRASLVAAGLLTLSAATLSAQSTRISCKDGSKPTVGHFSCWGHGGLVRSAAEAETMKAAPKEAKVNKAATKTAKADTKVAKATKAKKAKTKKGRKTHKKKSARTPTVTQPVKQSAK